MHTKVSNKEVFEINTKNLLNTESIYDNFPYKDYIYKHNCLNISNIIKSSKQIDSLIKNTFITNSIVTRIYTTELSDNLKIKNSLDSIYTMMIWADTLIGLSYNGSKESEMLKSIGDYWYNYSANTIENGIRSYPKNKYEFRFRYLMQKCSEKTYFTNTGHTNFEKVIIYVIDKRWRYLFYRFWNNTSVSFKIVTFLSIIFFIVLTTFGTKYLIIKIKHL